MLSELQLKEQVSHVICPYVFTQLQYNLVLLYHGTFLKGMFLYVKTEAAQGLMTAAAQTQQVAEFIHKRQH